MPMRNQVVVLFGVVLLIPVEQIKPGESVSKRTMKVGATGWTRHVAVSDYTDLKSEGNRSA